MPNSSCTFLLLSCWRAVALTNSFGDALLVPGATVADFYDRQFLFMSLTHKTQFGKRDDDTIARRQVSARFVKMRQRHGIRIFVQLFNREIKSKVGHGGKRRAGKSWRS